MNWLLTKFDMFWLWWNSRILDCPKTAYGYNCKHRIMSNGQRECGEWRSDEERSKWDY